MEMSAFDELVKGCLEFDSLGANVNCSLSVNLDEIEFLFPEQDQESALRTKVVAGFFICICFVGLVTNIGLLVSLFLGGKHGTTYKAPSTILIANLAVADALLLLTLPFSVTQRLEETWRFGFVFCKIQESLKFLSYYGSVFFLTAMAADRFLTVYRPTLYSRGSARTRLWLASMFVWVLAILVDVPIMIFSNIDEHGQCNVIFPGTVENYDFEETSGVAGSAMSNHISLEEFLVYTEGRDLESDYLLCQHHEAKSVGIWLTCNFIVGFVLPFMIISICYFMILRSRSLAIKSQKLDLSSDNLKAVVTNDENCNSPTSPTFPSILSKSRPILFSKRASKLLDIVIPCLIVAFLICWLPYHSWHLARIDGVNVEQNTCIWIQDFTFILAFSNSVINPILNSLFLFNFKNRLQKSASWLRKITNRKLKTNVNDQEEKFTKEHSCANVTFVTTPVH